MRNNRLRRNFVSSSNNVSETSLIPTTLTKFCFEAQYRTDEKNADN